MIMYLNKVRFCRQPIIRFRIGWDYSRTGKKRSMIGKGMESLLREGDHVMLYTPSILRGRCKKLECHWTGPYMVLKKISEVTYRI